MIEVARCPSCGKTITEAAKYCDAPYCRFPPAIRGDNEVPASKEYNKCDVIQGAMIAAIAATAGKIPHQVKKLAAEGASTEITQEWFFEQLRRLMKNVFHIELVEGTPEYELGWTIAKINADTYNMQNKLMKAMSTEGAKLSDIQRIYEGK